MNNQRQLQPVFNFTNPLASRADGSKEEFVRLFGALLDQFADDEKFAPVIAVINSGIEGLSDAMAGQRGEPTILVVPRGTSDATAVLLASLARPVRLRCSHFALIPAEIALDAPDKFAAEIYEAYVNARTSGKTIIYARRADTRDKDIAFETNMSDQRSNLLQVLASGPANDADRFDVAMEMGQLYCANGPIILSEASLNQAARQSTTAVISSCSSAMAVSDRRNQVLYPNVGFLSLVPGQRLVELLASNPETLLLHSGGELFRQGNDAKSAMVHEPSEFNVRCEEVGQECTRPWGNERLVSLKDGTRIVRLFINPGQKAVWPPSCQMVQWTIVSGSAFAKTGSDLRTASAGEVFNIVPGERHAITNIGAGELIVYEISMPAPAKNLQKSHARYG